MHKEIYTDIFTTVLSEMVKNEKQSNCSSTKERILKQARLFKSWNVVKQLKLINNYPPKWQKWKKKTSVLTRHGAT